MKYERSLYNYKGFLGLTPIEAYENYKGYAKRKAFNDALQGARRYHNHMNK